MLFLVLCGTVVFSCSSIKPTIEEPSCDQSLKEFIKDYWQTDTNGLVRLDIQETRDFCSEMLPENKCLMGKNKAQIEELFGVPHKIRLGKFMYYTIGTCFAENSKYCAYIHFDFDENGIYKTIGVSGWSKSH
jgi:hypothetical protein